MKLIKLKNAKHILIYGYGAEGKANYKFCRENFPKIGVSIYDDNIKKYKNKANFDNFDVIFVSPGIDRSVFDKNIQSKLTSSTEVFFENLDKTNKTKVIGISGTKGKSTTTKLISELLQNANKKVEIGGNFGNPLISLLLKIENLDFIVCELSSYQLENLKISPHYSVFLNFFADHLDRHENIKSYFEAKSNIWKWQTNNDFLIIPEIVFIKNDIKTNGQIIKSKILDKNIFKTSKSLSPKHIRQNCGTVAELANLLNITDNVLQKTFSEFQGLEHRMEEFVVKNKIIFVNDANATTPDATLAAVQYYKNKLGCLIVGGKNRGYDFDTVVENVIKYNPYIIILQSESGLAWVKLLKNNAYKKYKVVENMNNIVKTAFEKTEKEKTCLLSMGSPSYGYFKNFAEKGNLFKKLVREYKKDN